MTFDTDIKTLIQQRYNRDRTVFTFKPPERKPTVVIIDVMQWVKILTEHMNIRTTQDMVDYLVKRCARFNGPHVVALIISLDRSTPEIKRLICHGSRYRNVEVLSPSDGPHLPSNVHVRLSQAKVDLSNEQWLRFAASGDNLRRELAPLLVNAFLTSPHVPLLPHQSVYLNGFPVKFREVTVFDNPNPESFAVPEYGAFYRQSVPVAWTVDASGDGYVQLEQLDQLKLTRVCRFGDLPITPAMEKADPELYQRLIGKLHRSLQSCPLD